MSKKQNIQVGDFVTTTRYREGMRVEKCYNGAWTGLPMLECRDSMFKSLVHNIYLEDVTNHWRHKNESKARSGSKSSTN
jgi:hypothetical protein